jgi:DNA-binding transcriptional ArsR family regulator/uncharacterized protein YndB with AHSA1/START domain
MTQLIVSSKLFANPTRCTIIDLLRKKPYTTGALCEQFDLSRFAVMQHLKVLEKAGVISAEKQGRHRWNHLNHVRLTELESQIPVEPVQIISGLSTLSSANQSTNFVTEFLFDTTPGRLFEALTRAIGDWWKNASMNCASKMCLEAHLGGRLYEQFADPGNGILYGTIDQFKQGERLGFVGTMGRDNAISIIRMRLTAIDNEQTALSLQHCVIGDVVRTTLEAFQQSWQQLLGVQLKQFIEVTGDNYHSRKVIADKVKVVPGFS